MFVAIVVDGVPLDALVARLGVSRNALYKVVFDARGKIRSALVATGTCGAPRAGGPKPAAGANAKAARKATKQTAKGEAATAEGRVYRRSPSDLASVYQQAGSVAAVADHYNVPRHTAQEWIRTLRRRQASPAD